MENNYSGLNYINCTAILSVCCIYLFPSGLTATPRTLSFLTVFVNIVSAVSTFVNTVSATVSIIGDGCCFC